MSSMSEMSERVFVTRILMVFSYVLPGYEKYGDNDKNENREFLRKLRVTSRQFPAKAKLCRLCVGGRLTSSDKDCLPQLRERLSVVVVVVRFLCR
jgi:hypothetical protein